MFWRVSSESVLQIISTIFFFRKEKTQLSTFYNVQYIHDKYIFEPQLFQMLYFFNVAVYSFS